MNIPIVGTDVGGTCGRRVSFDCSTGLATIERVGQPEQTL
jgi:chemotaxis receptor (MCP) glutamine deamidase CheD